MTVYNLNVTSCFSMEIWVLLIKRKVLMNKSERLIQQLRLQLLIRHSSDTA